MDVKIKLAGGADNTADVTLQGEVTEAITAFLKLKPKTYDEKAYDHVERILADLQQELEKTESASVSVLYHSL